MTPVRALLIALTLALTVPAAAAAQEPAAPGATSGSIRGVAFDSLRAAPLAGAFAWVVGTSAAATSDSSGRFVIGDVPAGRQAVMVSHPALDSLGLPDLATVVEVTPGAEAALQLASPSPARLRALLCHDGNTFAHDGGIVFGSVRSGETRANLAGARVAAEWFVLAQNERGRIESQVASAIVETDELGVYRICGVPTGQLFTVRGFGPGAATDAIELQLVEVPIARQDLVIGLAPPSDTAPTAAAAVPRRTGTAALSGRVISEAGTPLAEALVVLPALEVETRSAEDGSFHFSALPAGSRVLEVRLPGYAPQSLGVALHANDTARVSVRLPPISTLATVRVRGARVSRQLQELAERQRKNIGYHYGGAALNNRGTLRSVFESTPSTLVQSTNTPGDYQVLMRSPSQGYCYPMIYIDGARSDQRELSSYLPSQLFAVEVYPRGSIAPVQFDNAVNGCGVIVAWTKYYVASR